MLTKQHEVVKVSIIANSYHLILYHLSATETPTQEIVDLTMDLERAL